MIFSLKHNAKLCRHFGVGSFCAIKHKKGQRKSGRHERLVMFIYHTNQHVVPTIASNIPKNFHTTPVALFSAAAAKNVSVNPMKNI